MLLPVSAAEDTAKKENDTRPFVQPFTVVALDNDTVLLAAVKEMFAHHGVMCTTCGCVRDLMECIRRQNYDLLITDLKMPQMNGFDVLKLLRTANVRETRGPFRSLRPPLREAAIRRTCMRRGFRPACKKPFSVEELLQVCTGCLGDERQQEQIDFHALLEYGDRLEMLETLIRETTDDIAAMAESAERNDCESLREWTHHLSSSWEIIHAGKTPAGPVHAASGGLGECSAEEFGRAVRKVLDKGKEIIDLAQQAKESYESDCG